MIDEEPTRRTLISRAPAHEETPLVNAEKLGLATSGTLYGMPDTFEEADVSTQFQVMDMSNPSASSYSFNEPVQRSSIDFSASGSLVSLCTDRPLTFGPVSLLGTSSKLAQPPNQDPPSQYTPPSARVSTDLPSDTGKLLASGCLTPHAQSQDEATTHEDEGSERVISVIHPELALDKTAESNALPFVIQAYGAWIGRLALDPLKLRGIARDFVFSHFRDGDESRWIIGLLANIGSRVGRVELVESRPTRMISMLQSAVRRRLGVIKSCPNPKRSALANALEFATQAMLVHFYVGPVSEAIILVHEAAPVFRQLCPERSNAPIDLPSLLQHPLTCLRYYAHIDILMSAVSDKPTLFRYEAPVPNSESSNHYRPAQAIQSDGIVQWLRGTPDEMILLFAKMKMVRQDGIAPDKDMVASLERDICELRRFNGLSSDRFLAIMRSIVHECWRQAAYIYLYMAVCGDSSDTPRVKEAFKRYMRLLNGTQPGRLPDEFLILTLQIISPAAQRQRDRQTITQRALGLYTRDRTYIANIWIMFVVKDVWARAAAEDRPVVWSDIAASRKQFLGS